MVSSGNQHARCSSAGRVTAGLVLSLLTLIPSVVATTNDETSRQNGVISAQLPIIDPFPAHPELSNSDEAQRFTLRHAFYHGTSRYPNLHIRHDVPDPNAPVVAITADGDLEQIPPLLAQSRNMNIQRLVDRRPSVVDPIIAAARESGQMWVASPSVWTVDEVRGPNISDKATIISLAQMCSNAYLPEPGTGNWENVDPSYGLNESLPFGWEADSLQGHVYSDDQNETLVLAIKGTTMAVWDGAGTTTNDKENDNLFGSCCCAQQGNYLWHQVCDCARGTYSCNNTCVIKELRQENRYYQASRHLYSNVTALYPKAKNIWLTGHSLGGTVSSLLGLTYGLPTVTFEAVPDALAAGRLGLPTPPGTDAGRVQTRQMTGAYHFGHTADPVYMGKCTGPSASCSLGGYSFESACHSGLECVYRVVEERGWRVSITTHGIQSVIHDVLEKYDTVPECLPTPECIDCAIWNFFESNSSAPTTSLTSSSSSTNTRTRTATCQTPGWWGCLDETTTATGTTTTTSEDTTTSSSSSTHTCETPGWFGCNDKTSTTTSSTVTSTTSTTTTSTSTTSSTTCETPGWFGCNDSTPPTTSTTSAASPAGSPHSITSPPTLTSSTAETPSLTGSTKLPTSTSPPGTRKTCIRRNWLGFCKEWGIEFSIDLDRGL